MLTGTAALFAGCENGSSSQTQSGTTSENTEETSAPAEQKVTEKEAHVANGAILQCFSWDFNTIKESIPDIAAAGFTAVQTSPVNECLPGENGGMELYGDGKWYYHYQPTDFKIGNYQLGTRDEFKAMCDEAEKYGVSVIVDIIANHTTPQLDAVSEELVKAGGGSFETLFHEHNKGDITDYSDRLQCTTAKMGGLPDINTERPSFQDYFLTFVNDCIDCGADGFRYDTAKHIGLPDDPKEEDGFENNFWPRVTTEIHNADDMFIYGEVLQGGNDRLADYISVIGRTTASTYGSKIRSALMNNMIDTSAVKEYWIGSAPDSRIVTWVESHDNYINDGTWFELNNEQVILGWCIISARQGGTPLFFSRPYLCSDSSEWGMNRIGAQGDDMYKDARVSAVNFFRQAMTGEEETLVNPENDSTALLIERGDKGVVIVNTSGELKVDFDINLPDGEYTDRVDGKTVYTVKGGKLTSASAVPENSVVVLYNEGYTEHTAHANVGVAEDTQFVIGEASTEVTLTLENADEGTYALNGGKETAFKNGDKVKVEKPSDGNVARLELRAKNPDGTSTYERAEFTFRRNKVITKGTKVYFKKPDRWGDEINIYIYNLDDEESKPWPGSEMTKESDGTYSYAFLKDWDNPLIIFNEGEGGAQYPADRGFDVEPDKAYTVE